MSYAIRYNDRNINRLRHSYLPTVVSNMLSSSNAMATITRTSLRDCRHRCNQPLQSPPPILKFYPSFDVLQYWQYKRFERCVNKISLRWISRAFCCALCSCKLRIKPNEEHWYKVLTFLSLSNEIWRWS